MKPNRVLALGLPVMALIVAATTVEAQRQRGTPRFKEEIQVTPDRRPEVRGSAGVDHFMTFSGPVALPNVSLASGTYVFRVDSAQTIQVMNADKSRLYAWVHTTSVKRDRETRNYEIWFGAPMVEGSPSTITAWFRPGQREGYAFMYPDQQAQQLQPVLNLAAR